jgi:phosphohistidine phosphatase
MILTIWRHGTAQEGGADHFRELTVSGRDDVSFGCHQFHQACKLRSIPQITSILHSPLVRTIETAEIVAGAFGSATLESANALQPGSRLADAEALITRYGEPDNCGHHLALVSHQPLVSRIIDHYLGGSGTVPPLPPGGLATLSLDVAAPACAKLLFWSFPPEYEVGV